MILEGRGVCVRASCSLRGKEIVLLLLLLFLLVRRYVPAQDPLEQTLTPRDEVGANKRERECEKGEEREKRYGAEERVEHEGETG
jgi:hypothetical protein